MQEGHLYIVKEEVGEGRNKLAKRVRVGGAKIHQREEQGELLVDEF